MAGAQAAAALGINNTAFVRCVVPGTTSPTPLTFATALGVGSLPDQWTLGPTLEVSLPPVPAYQTQNVTVSFTPVMPATGQVGTLVTA
jgi:hypothetical protein